MHNKQYLHDPMYFMPTRSCGRNTYWKSAPDAPAAPDYEAASKATADGNLEYAKYATQANRANQYTPWGQLTWTNNPIKTVNNSAYNEAQLNYQKQLNDYNAHTGAYAPTVTKTDNSSGHWESIGDGRMWVQNNNWDSTNSSDTNTITKPSTLGAPTAPNIEDYTTNGGDNWAQTTSLTPELQAALDSQIAVQQGRSTAAETLLGRVTNKIDKPVDFSSAGKLNDTLGYDPTQAKQFQQAAFDAQRSLLDPMYDQQEQRMQNANALKGLANTSDAYISDQQEFNRNKSAAYNALANSSMLSGQQVARANYDSYLKGNASQNMTHQAKIEELMSEYNAPLNQLNSLLTGQQVQNPQFSSYAGQSVTGGPDYMNAAQLQSGYNQSAYNAEAAGVSAANSNTGSAIGAIASIAMMY